MRPQVEYASTIWSPHTKQNTQKIEVVQRRAARWVNNNYSTYDSVSTMLDNLGWRSLENRRIDSRLFMFHRIIYGYVAIQIPTYFEKPQRFTRHMHPLSTDRSTPMQFTTSSRFTQQQLFYGINSRQRLFSWMILTPLKKESARSTISPLNFLNTVFNLSLNLTLH